LPPGSFSDYQAVNNFKWDCNNAFTGVQNIGAEFQSPCAPTRYQMSVMWEIQKRVRYSIYFRRVTAGINFGDGSPWIYLHNQDGEERPDGNWRFPIITGVHTYPILDVCTFEPRAVLEFWNYHNFNAFRCNNVLQTYQIPSYQLDNTFSGDLILFPEIGNPDNEYCVGEDIESHRFRDLTLFNCRFEVEPNLPNAHQRWVQFVYGTGVNLGPEGRIPNVWLDTNGDEEPDTQITDENGNLIGPHEDGLYIGDVINYNQLPLPGAVGTGYPDAISLGIFHEGNFEDVAGMRFEVTMRQWGPCNPWDEFDYMDNVIVERSYIELIESPPPPNAPNRTFCQDEVGEFLTATGGAGTLHWYAGDDVDMLTPLWISNAPFPHGKTEPGVYTFWVREIQLPSPPGCIGEPREVTLTILPTD
jgi:hypothetical protein